MSNHDISGVLSDRFINKLRNGLFFEENSRKYKKSPIKMSVPVDFNVNVLFCPLLDGFWNRELLRNMPCYVYVFDGHFFPA